eukprot:TRINITY_DN10803_c1_g1_i1.p1 TRINITY_DN10803_c1_g1~~TRINITY_DN10803_c1_g1_i1.p1  ORF type:complete len:266 (+),score=9.62 TRINITY_DN10803_c1_g1_i1:60-857(+)
MEQLNSYLDDLDVFLADFFNVDHYYETDKFLFTHITTPFCSTIIFLLSIIFLKLTNIKIGNARKTKTLHNLILFILSTTIVILAIYYFIEDYTTIPRSFCKPAGYKYSKGLFMVEYIYYLSKFYEYVDTFFLITSSSKPLGFLHVYHHTVVPWITWVFLRGNSILSVQGLTVNASVHVIMYFYYTLSSYGIKDIWWKKYITSIQILQFVSSLLLGSVYVYFYFTLGQNQCVAMKAFLFTTFFNITFLFLFTDFYKSSYSKSKKQE